MRRSTSRSAFVRRALTVVVATATLSVGLAIPAAAAPGVRYVALGDSRAAGPSITSSFVGDGCGRSGGGYPERVARALHASFTDAACTAAVSEDVIDRPQQTSPPISRKQPIQDLALRRNTSLVTLSIGGNDIKWGSLISPCFGLSPQIDRHCRDDAALRRLIATRLATLSGSLDRVLGAIDDRSPSARVFVVGHGGYYGSRGCFPDAGMSTGDAAFVLEFFREFNGVLADAARRHGASFVDIAGPAVGHDACAPVGQRWFTGQLPVGNGLPNHPTPLGNAAMARLVLAAIAG